MLRERGYKPFNLKYVFYLLKIRDRSSTTCIIIMTYSSIQYFQFSGIYYSGSNPRNSIAKSKMFYFQVLNQVSFLFSPNTCSTLQFTFQSYNTYYSMVCPEIGLFFSVIILSLFSVLNYAGFYFRHKATCLVLEYSFQVLKLIAQS